jgi:hypothetical protein
MGSGNVIGKVSKAQPFSDTDAALAVVSESNVCANVIENLGTIRDFEILRASDIGKRVLKRGRTTGVTEGTIEAIGITVPPEIGNITDCVTVRAKYGELFSNSGDSGSPVILSGIQKLVGLHFASNREYGGVAYFCKIDNVFRNLGVKLPS